MGKTSENKNQGLSLLRGSLDESKMVYTVYPDHLEMFVPSSRVKIEKREN